MAGTGLDEIIGDSAIDTVGIRKASVDVNHIHKVGHSVQLPVMSHTQRSSQFM